MDADVNTKGENIEMTDGVGQNGASANMGDGGTDANTRAMMARTCKHQTTETKAGTQDRATTHKAESRNMTTLNSGT